MRDNHARVEELVNQLAPVLGEHVRGLLVAWLAEDEDGRREIEQWLELEALRRFGNTPTTFAPPRQEDLPAEGISVGHVTQAGKRLFPLKMPLSQLNKHVLIAGASGSGKTTLIYHFVQGLLEQAVPFFLYDFNLDYRPLARLSDKVKVFTIGDETAPLPFNPLAGLIQLCQAKSQLHDLNPLFQLADVICKAFYVGAGVKSILCAALAQAARNWAQQDFAVEHTPSFRTVLAWVREHEPKDLKGMRFKEWKVSTVRALESLCTGTFGASLAVTRDKHVSTSVLKKESVIFELNLPEDLKRFFVEMMMLCMRQHALQEVKLSGKGRLRNVMILDEAHNLLKKTEEKVESQLAIALREHRGLGTGYIIADQVPSQLDDSAIANTHTKFFFTLDNSRDLRTAGQSLLLENTDVLSRLPTGTALCRFGTHSAFAVTLDPMDHLKHVPVSDEEIARNAGDSTYSTPETPALSNPGMNPPPTLSDKDIGEGERKLLERVLAEPFAGLSRHYKAAKLSTRKGQHAKEQLEKRGLVEAHEILKEIPGGGKIVVLELTQAGVELLRELGHEARWPYYTASPEHEYWKDQAAQHYANKGFRVEKEHRLPQGCAVDVHAEKPGQTIAIEVETGKSNPVENIRKAINASYSEVVSLATNSATAEATEHALQAALPKINSSYRPLNPSLGGKPELINASYRPDNFVKRDDLAPINSSYPVEKHTGVKVQTVAALQPTAEEFINRFFSLTGAEKLLVMDVLDFPDSSMSAREERLARSGVPPASVREALAACLDSGLILGDDDNLELARTTRDTFRTLGILRY